MRSRRSAIRTRSLAVQACPLHAHWLDGTPITGVLPMAGILDRKRRFVVDGTPVATGFAAVGDAWACTNPSAGRGLSIGLMHAQRLRDVLPRVTRHVTQLPARLLAREWDAVTEAELTRGSHQRSTDEARLAELVCARAAPRGHHRQPAPAAYQLAGRAAMFDADVFRGLVETIGCLALPDEVFGRPGMWAKVEAAAPAEAMVMPGPTREELLALLG